MRVLAARDTWLADIVQRWGPPPLWDRPPGFATLVRIMLEQQVSLAAAATMYARIESHVGDVTPAAIGEFGIDGLRTLGLTRQKASFCHRLATGMDNGAVDLDAMANAPDDEARRMLCALHGIGPWSADIYRLMALGRPDVWPEGDLALAVTLRDGMGLREVPSRHAQREIAARWAPFRSVAARIVWTRYLGERNRL